MAVSVGTKLGPYEVLSPLGAGGMGEVWRARDTQLNRDVALKVLPEVLARDPERMARFRREAQVLASLNHPNIATIHGLEESGGLQALVMELVEGQTLAERIGGDSVGEHLHGAPVSTQAREGRKGPPLPLDDALPIAKQIAEGLEYAHERGIIHRDLKPANIKITPEGTVKILDFGLAKALYVDASSSNFSDSPTLSPTLSIAATQAGVILGTAAYMSPEQARGKVVDRRADIWAFGCVLYEMLTGKRTFGGETVSDTLAAILTKDADWNALPVDTPQRIREVIRRCLTKDAKRRLQAIGDARVEIEETIHSVAPGFSPAASDAALKGDATTGDRRSPLKRTLPWGFGVAGLFAAAVLAFVHFGGPSVPVQSIRSLIPAPEKVPFAFDRPSGVPLLSPDGTKLIFPARDASDKAALWLRPLDSLSAQPLAGTDGAEFPFWAPDSRQVGFFQDGKLKKVDLTGGPPVLVCDAPGARGGTWSRDGVIIFAPQSVVTAGGLGGELMQVPAAGGTPIPVASRKGSSGTFSNRWPVFLPDGRHFLYLSGDLNAAGTDRLGVYLGELGTEKVQFLLQADSDALYSAPGYLVFLRGTTLMGQRFDAASQKLQGEAFPVAEQVGSPEIFRLGLFSVSQTGLLVYTADPGAAGGQLTWFDASGKELGTFGPPGVHSPRLSPDGKRLAFVVGGGLATNSGDIWLMDLEQGTQARFTFGPRVNVDPVWSPEGSKILYTSLRHPPGYDLYVKDSSGAGNSDLLFASDFLKLPSDCSRDGRYLLFTESASNARWAIRVLPLSGDRKPFAYLHNQFNNLEAKFSPDGRWIAYTSDDSGDYQVYLAPFPAQGGKWQVSPGGGVQPEWSRDGSTLYYLAPGGKLMQASIKEASSGVVIGAPRELFHVSMDNPGPAGHAYGVAPDGKRFLVDKASEAASLPLTLVTNWTAALDKK